jgi:hypothetical protein
MPLHHEHPSTLPHRRDFLRAGSAATLGVLGANEGASKPPSSRARHCILLFLVGGPSQLETWDPKPDAPAEVRGPFRTIATDVSGIRLSEHLPRTASLARHYAIIRSLHHTEAPIHETGLQLLQTGRLAHGTVEPPHLGAVLSRLLGPLRDGIPPFVLLPGPLGNTGVNISHGQGAGYLGTAHAPRHLPAELPRAYQLTSEPEALRDRYGRTSFGESCLRARRLVEQGVRCVTVNMFDGVYDRVTWDCHAAPPILPGTLDDYRRTLCPMFDQAFAALLEDLRQTGLLEQTLVAVLSEFGRTPRLNTNGGRDHWPGAWSVVLAGGGVRGGQVIGSTDRLGAEPAQRPVRPADVLATLYQALGVDVQANLPGSEGRPVCEGRPIGEVGIA